MPNYKIFQDYADSLRTKIYGIDESGSTTPLLTNASGKLDVVGNVEFSGQVSGTVTVSGEVSGTVKVSSGIEVSGGTIEVSGQVSGTVTVSGEVSGTVTVSSGVEVSGIVNTSGNALYVRGAIVDSGPVSSGISGQDSGVFGEAYWDVLGYRSWTFAVKYSGDSGDFVSARLQISPTASGSDWVNVDPSPAYYSGTTLWNLFTTTYQLRYARAYYVNDSGASGAMALYFQAEY